MSFEDGWKDFVNAAGPILAEELSNQAPVVTGELAASMTWEEEGEILTAGSRGERAPVAAYVTRGTRGPYDIYPVFANALHFVASDGTEVFTQHVVHPGIAANPFHIAAWEARRDEVLELFRTRVSQGVLTYLNPWKNRTP